MTTYLAENLWLVWSIAMTGLLILEISSGDFYLTCFAAGSLCAALLSLTGIPFWAQCFLFALCSVLSIWLLRPALVRRLHAGSPERPSNADALLGRTAEVSETIRTGGYGRVKIDGDDWKAQAAQDREIPRGSKVRVTGRESIILTVEEIAASPAE